MTTPNSNTKSTPVSIDAVPGLSVCSEFFSPAVESSLYNDPLLFDYSPDEVPGICQAHQATHGKKLNRIMTPMHAFQMPQVLPKLLVKVCNGITESGLCPEFIAPNYCLPISYPANGQFFYHYDSRKRWGETVVGTTLGTGGVMSFQPQTKKAKGSNGPPFVGKRVLNHHGLVVEIRKSTSKQGQESFVVDVHLPPRSVYVMAGDARTEWKHMVKTNNAANRALGGMAGAVKTNPALSDCVVRRTITLRCTKAFSDEVLARLLRSNPSDAVVKARVKAQSKWRPQDDYGDVDLTGDELRNLRLKAVGQCNAVHGSFSSLFLTASERGYVTQHPGKCCWPLQGIVGADQPSSLVGNIDQQESSGSSSSQKPRASNSNNNKVGASRSGGDKGKKAVASSSRLSSSSLSRGGAAPALSKEELRAKRCLFYATSESAAGAASADSAAATSVGGHDKKKQNRKQPPPAAADSGAAAAAIDLSGDGSDDDENSKPPAKKKPKKNTSIEIIEID